MDLVLVVILFIDVIQFSFSVADLLIKWNIHARRYAWIGSQAVTAVNNHTAHWFITWQTASLCQLLRSTQG